MNRDPRGPLRTITKVETPIHLGKDGQPYINTTLVTMDCGHTSDMNPIYTYRKGDSIRCYRCGLIEDSCARA
jgi:hypothetical protein